MVLSLNRFVSPSPVLGFGALIVTLPLTADSVDQILARVNDAGGFDAQEAVWLLSAYVTFFLEYASSSPIQMQAHCCGC